MTKLRDTISTLYHYKSPMTIPLLVFNEPVQYCNCPKSAKSSVANLTANWKVILTIRDGISTVCPPPLLRHGSIELSKVSSWMEQNSMRKNICWHFYRYFLCIDWNRSSCSSFFGGRWQCYKIDMTSGTIKEFTSIDMHCNVGLCQILIVMLPILLLLRHKNSFLLLCCCWSSWSVPLGQLWGAFEHRRCPCPLCTSQPVSR